MPLIRVLLASALLLPTQALGACTDILQADLKPYFDRSSEAIGNDDLIGHGTTVRELKEALPCLNDQLEAPPWAAFLVELSIVKFSTGQEWQTALDTAYRIDSNLHIDYGPPDIRQYLPKRSTSEMRAVADNGSYFLDGLPLNEAGKLEGLHIAQRFADESWETRVLENAPFPEEWLAPKPAAIEAAAPSSGTTKKKKVSGLLIAGGTMAAVGSAGGIASWLTIKSTPYPTEKQVSNMTTVNVASWSVAILGAGLGVTGVLTSPESASPVRLHFSGNYLHLKGIFP
jgi:hypothetical protein